MNIAAYCRVSTDKSDQLNSLETQKQFFTEYVQRTGDHLVKVYADATDIIGLKQNPTKRASLQSYFFVYRAFFDKIRGNATSKAKEAEN